MSPSKKNFLPCNQAQKPFFVGVDLGGTNIKVGMVDELGRPLSFLTIPTEAAKGPEDASMRMGRAVLKVIEQAGADVKDVAAVGLGSPGTMDIPAGMLVKPVNLKGWDHFPLRDRVAQHCGLTVVFANDANAAAYGEFWVGSGRDFHSLVLFTLGTGIGSGIIIGDMSIDGENSHGGECGHLIIDYSPNARLCNCGQRGHLEAYASATSVIKRTREALDAGRTSSLRDCPNFRVNENGTVPFAGGNITPKLIAQHAEKGDPLCLEIIVDTARYLGVGITNVMHTVDPSGVLLGGAMTFGGNETELGRRFLAEIKAEVRRRAFPMPAENTVIDFASLGGDAGYIGAAGIARVQFHKNIGKPLV
jgi:glucokinase